MEMLKDKEKHIAQQMPAILYLYRSSKKWYSILASPFGWAERRASTFITKSLALKRRKKIKMFTDTQKTCTYHISAS